jgi:hypothetical protein
MKPIRDWIASSRLVDAWKLQVADDDAMRVDWAYIWFAFQEYITYDREKSQLTVSVIGYD